LSEYGKWAEFQECLKKRRICLHFPEGSEDNGLMRSAKVFFTAAVVCVFLAFGSVALAQSGGNVNPPDIESETIDPQGRDTSTPPSGALPFTGADVTLFVAIGLGAIGAGSLIVRRTRKADTN
jgi:LPXTG-motif cell wall-anchored protein